MTLSLRRLRASDSIRALFSETSLEPRHLLQPYFIVPEARTLGEAKPGTALFRVSADMILEELRPLARAGLRGVMLFGVPTDKHDDARALEAQLEDTRRAIGEIKSALPELTVFADVCLCSYTTHGHCGVIHEAHVHNGRSVEALCDMALRLSRAGTDFVCPSDMMDGRVAAIRRALDEAGHERTGIVSYAVKMASAFYGPFRHAADSAPRFGDRKTYQMPAGNRREALRELALDEAEGADVLLVKPALTNLDLLRDAREQSSLPLFAYQVSGEYAMLRAAADAGFLEFERAMEEALVSIRRAGADAIVSYYAREWLRR